MKTFIIGLCLTLCATLSIAQQKGKQLNERLFEAKLNEMAFQLQMNEEQKNAFEPIYKHFCEDMLAAWNEKTITKQAQTQQEVVEQQKLHIERQQRVQAIRLRYIDEFATVLNANQLQRIYIIENQIQHKIKAHREHRKQHNGRR